MHILDVLGTLESLNRGALFVTREVLLLIGVHPTHIYLFWARSVAQFLKLCSFAIGSIQHSEVVVG